jgi:hypothetical protein
MDGTNKRRMNDALDWMFEQLWNTPKDKFEWSFILKKARDMQKEHKPKESNSTPLTANVCDKQKTEQDN